MLKCIHCNYNKVYTLANGYIKCSSCKRKYSLKKQKAQEEILKLFCKNINALEASKKLNRNYITISNRYKLYRSLIVNYIEQNYENIKTSNYEFDEYIYIKNKELKNSHNFLTFNYSNYIYNMILPPLNRYNTSNNSNELRKFLRYNKIAKLQSLNSYINDFWTFFEDFLKKYKGVDRYNFNIYLKEAEFKFNYPVCKQEKILKKQLNKQ
ncbi:MAG: transposase [Campylobacterota bacterium]